MSGILTRRCRPLKTTAKAPCPIKSLVLYSYSPTWTILLFEWESIMHFCLCTRTIAFSLPNILSWLLIRAQMTIQANRLASNGWKTVHFLNIRNLSLAFTLISGYYFTCTILWDLYTVWSHWLTLHIKWIFKLSSSHNCLFLFASISIVPYLFTISLLAANKLSAIDFACGGRNTTHIYGVKWFDRCFVEIVNIIYDNQLHDDLRNVIHPT